MTNRVFGLFALHSNSGPNPVQVEDAVYVRVHIAAFLLKVDLIIHILRKSVSRCVKLSF